MNQNQFINTINPFKDKVFRLAKRLLVSTEEAQDATQEVLVKLWNKNEELEKLNSIEAYAITLTKNYCLDVLKSKRANNLQLVHTNYEASTNLQNQIEYKNAFEIVEKWINNLPEQQKIILQLRDIEQQEFEVIAAQLNMNETAVRVALSRARKTIREKMIALKMN